MGFLNILKKNKNTKPTGLTPINNSSQEMNIDNSENNNIPPIDDIPLPPKPDNNMSEIGSGLEAPINPKTEENNKSNIEQEIPPPPVESQDFNDIPLPPKEENENKIENVSTEVTDKEDMTNESDEEFKLPDFDEEDLKIGEEIKEFEEGHKDVPGKIQEEKENGLEEAEVIDDVSPPEPISEITESNDLEKDSDWTQDDIEETKEEEVSEPNSLWGQDLGQENGEVESSSESIKEEAEDTTKTEPITKNENIELEKNHYLSVENCYNIFEDISFIQETMKEIMKKIQKNEFRKEMESQSKLFHEDLDIAQEKLMQAENILFER